MREPAVLVPVKAGRGAKRRLSHVLGISERRGLIHALVLHVHDVLSRCGLTVRIVASGGIDPPWGAEISREVGPGLNTALAAPIAAAGFPVLVVVADLPWLTPGDVDALLAQPGDVVVARSSDGGTTGLLLRRPIPTAFGPGSALIHARMARSTGLRARVVDLPGFAEDLDDPSTFVRALASPAAGAIRAAAGTTLQL